MSIGRRLMLSVRRSTLDSAGGLCVADVGRGGAAMLTESMVERSVPTEVEKLSIEFLAGRFLNEGVIYIRQFRRFDSPPFTLVAFLQRGIGTLLYF
jgi:hypothetical protein